MGCAKSQEVKGEPTGFPSNSGYSDWFKIGKDQAFKDVVGLFGMLAVCLNQRTTGVPDHPDEASRDGFWGVKP